MLHDPHELSAGRSEGWRLLSTGDVTIFESARLTLHYAVQLLASFGQALAEPQDDDSHRSMTWDSKRDAFRSEPSRAGLRALLDVPAFTLEVWLDESRTGALDLNGRTPNEARRWLEDALANARTPAPVLEWPEYDLPARPEAWDGVLEPDGTALDALAAWFGSAESLLHPLAEGTREASTVRCWPHHFDLATLLSFPGDGPEDEGRYVGLGLSPGDASRALPYYYVNGSPAPAPGDLPPLRGPGQWNTEGWVGAVLTAEEVLGASDAPAQRAVVAEFLTEAQSAMRSVVLRRP